MKRNLISLIAMLTVSIQTAARAAAEEQPAFLSLPARVIDPTNAAVLWRTAHRPELLTHDYLKYFIGPADGKHNRGSSHSWYWHDHLRRMKYELHHELDSNGNVRQAMLISHLNNSQLNVDILSDAFGAKGKRFFDHRSHLTDLWSFAPYTSLSVSEAQNSFALQKATVAYSGPPLAGPSEADWQTAHDHMISKTYIGEKPDWRQLTPWIQDRLAHHPEDPDAHLAYSDVLLQSGNLHDAANHAKTALQLAPDEATRAKAVAALVKMRIFPAPVQQNAPVSQPPAVEQQVASSPAYGI